MITNTKPQLTTKDNGYFEVWTRPCGHRYRVTTEGVQYRKSTRGAEVKFLRDRAANRPCSQCAEDHS
jgi:hypothetical protein